MPVILSSLASLLRSPLLVISLLSLQRLFLVYAVPFYLEDFPCFPVGGKAGFIYQYHKNSSDISSGGDCDSSGADGSDSDSSCSYPYPRPQQLPKVPPFIFIKTHKTGSTSMANILHRIADIRNLTVLASLQGNNSRLGWPEEFPGPFAKSHYAYNSADAIINHSIFDRETMLKYMRHGNRDSSHSSTNRVLVFTTLRDPYNQAISSYKFFSHATPWKEYFKHLKHEAALVPEGAPFSAKYARAKNSQAYDLGWYRNNGWRFHNDDNAAAIAAFVAKLEREVQLFICLEDWDRGLVLLSHLLGVAVNEMVSIDLRAVLSSQQKLQQLQSRRRLKDSKQKEKKRQERQQKEMLPVELPDANFYKPKIDAINRVDRAIYDHFCSSGRNSNSSSSDSSGSISYFERMWRFYAQEVATARQHGSSQPSLEQRLRRLQLLQARVTSDCAVATFVGTERCPRSLLISETPYTGYFLYKQNGSLPACNY